MKAQLSYFLLVFEHGAGLLIGWVQQLSDLWLQQHSSQHKEQYFTKTSLLSARGDLWIILGLSWVSYSFTNT